MSSPATSGSQRPRLLFVTSSLDIGGTESHLAKLTTALARRGWPVTIFCFNSRGMHADTVAAAGVDVVGPPIEAELNQTPKARRVMLATLAAGRLARLIVEQRPTIAHFFLAEAYIAGAPLALALGVPIRIMSRRSLNLYQRHLPGSAQVERWLHARMSAVLGNSRAILRELAGEEGCAADKLGLIYNGVEIDRLRPVADRRAIRAALGIPEDALLAIKVANLNPYKGHGDLIAALGLIKDRLPRPWAVVCVGREKGNRAGLEAQARQAGIADNFRLVGPRTDVADLLAAADIGLLCSHEEGFSNAIIESMAAGLPMIVTDVGGNPEAVLDRQTGLVVPPHASKPLGEAIVELAADPDMRRRYGEAGRRRAEALFTMASCIDRYEALYDGLIAGRSVATIPEVSPAL